MSSSSSRVRTGRPSRGSLRLLPDDAECGVFGRRAGSAADGAVDAAVRAYVSRCKADGVPVEQVLVRLVEDTRRYRLTSRLARHPTGLRGAVFRAFLLAYYGDDDTSGSGGRPRRGTPRARGRGPQGSAQGSA